MKTRELGKSGLFVSELSLGTMSLPSDLFVAEGIIDTALDAGINFLDTADLYNNGNIEQLVGQLVKGKRHEIILATKVGNRINADGNGWSWDPSKAHITDAIKKSLMRLGTDYIDLYQLHGGTMDDNVDETIDALEGLKKEGLIRQYGISSIRPTVIKRFLEKSSGISVMMQYSLLDRRPEEWFPMITEMDASVITRGTVAKGLLTDEGLSRSKSIDGFVDYQSAELVKTIQNLTEETESLQAASIAFVLQDKSVATALVGASSKEQILGSINAYEKGYPSTAINELKHLVEKHQYNEHRLV